MLPPIGVEVQRALLRHFDRADGNVLQPQPGVEIQRAGDAPRQRRELAAVWLAAGSAVSAMVAASWLVIVGRDGRPPGGDMVGHAATAEWLRTLPWWDWRGWSDWFYGGQAIGVNYPPLGHALMRFTHPVHGQMAAVAVGLLVLLPWGSLRLARAVGYSPRSSHAAMAAAMILAAGSASMHWVLSGFHPLPTFYGSWPAMLATVIGLFPACYAAGCRRPVPAGALLGVAGLFNATVLPGVAVVCGALLMSSGTSFGKGLRWCATAASAALAVSAWWLVPFVAGWDRLVRWEVSLARSLAAGHPWQAAGLAGLGAVTIWVARSRAGPPRRLALAALAGLGATLLGDLSGYLRPERWLELSILVAALAAAGLVARREPLSVPPVRAAWAVLAGAFLVVLVVVTARWEVLPLAVWLLWRPRRVWVGTGALAWAAVLLLVPLLQAIPDRSMEDPAAVIDAVAGADPRAGGLVYIASSDEASCPGTASWHAAVETGGLVRPLHGLYRETSPAAEFLDAGADLRGGAFGESGRLRPHWLEAWQARGEPSLDSPSAAEALGARWYATCDRDGHPSVSDVGGVLAGGVTVEGYATEAGWHRAAVEWWMSLASGAGDPSPGGSAGVPVLAPDRGDGSLHPHSQAASGVVLHTEQDGLGVTADSPGWVWIRVPWDPYWTSTGGSAVHKGGPGHLVVWASHGTTELRWSVPGSVNVAAAAVTGAAAAAAGGLAMINRRAGWTADAGRRRRPSEALEVFAVTVDGWARAGADVMRRALSRPPRI